jgi:tRNA (guanine-N7-)-methyltransferase
LIGEAASGIHSRQTMTLHGRKNNFEEQLRQYPDIAAGGADVFARRGAWRQHFEKRIGRSFGGRIILEVGCADASFLSDVAAKHPAVAFVGLDWKFKSLLTGAQRIAAAELRNVALLRGRAQDLLKIFSPGEVDEIWVFHPEPCPEPPQRKNRLIAEPFLNDAHELLSNQESVVAIKTDHAGYFQWIHRLLALPAPALSQRVRLRDVEPADDLPEPSNAARSRFELAASSADFWQDPSIIERTKDRCFAGSVTPYENRFVQKRRPIHYIELRKIHR